MLKNGSTDFLGPRNGDDVVPLREKPRERNLPCSSAVSVSDLFEAVGELQNIGEILVVVLWKHPAEIAFRKVSGGFLKCGLKNISENYYSGILTTWPVRIPRPSGEYATTVIPSSRQTSRTPICGSSISRLNGEYSTSTAATGCTAWARRIVAAETSESPIYLILPFLG